MGRRSNIHLGQKFGHLIVKEIIPSNEAGKHSKIRCLCDCGNETIVQSHLLKKKIKSCGCKQRFYNDLSGKIIGKTTIVRIVKENSEFNNNRGHLYLCKCNDCNREYNFQCSSMTREGFLGCRCDKDKKSCKNSIYAAYRLNARNRGLKFNISLEEFVNICEKPCYYCGRNKSNTSKSSELNIWNYNGVDRINNSKGYYLSNCVACCGLCNRMKMDLTKDEFINHIQLINNFSKK